MKVVKIRVGGCEMARLPQYSICSSIEAMTRRLRGLTKSGSFCSVLAKCWFGILTIPTPDPFAPIADVKQRLSMHLSRLTI